MKKMYEVEFLINSKSIGKVRVTEERMKNIKEEVFAPGNVRFLDITDNPSFERWINLDKVTKVEVVELEEE